MTEQHESYRVWGTDVDSVISHLNQIFNLISNRLDRIEGLRGTPTIYTSQIDYPGQSISGALVAGESGETANFAEPITVTFSNTGLHILDTDASHDLIIAPGSNLTADRTLTLTTGNASRTITISGNPTLADWFDQAVKKASDVEFNRVQIIDENDEIIHQLGDTP